MLQDVVQGMFKTNADVLTRVKAVLEASARAIKIRPDESVGASLRENGVKTMSELVLAVAQKIVAASIAHGREKNLMKLAVVVLDARGALKSFAAEEGTSLKRGEIAIGKANAALAMGLGTRSINKMAKDRPYFIGSVTNAVGGSFVPVPGGVLIKDQGGAIMGAVGISGDVSDNDEAAAVAGIAAAGLVADPGKD